VRLALAVLSLSLASCLVRIDYDGTRFSCEEESICPRGYQCEGGVCVLGAGDPDAGEPPGDSRFRRQLTFDNGGRGELVGFPALVALDANRIDYGAVLPGGADLRFADAGGEALPHEIERWDPGGTSIVWVRVPRIGAGSTTDFIYMLYGDPDASDGQAPAQVWADYQAVYHLGESLEDSSPQGLHGENAGTAVADGVVGQARSFDGIDQYVDLGIDRPFVRDAPAFTLSTWIRLDPEASGIMVPFASSIDNQGELTNLSRAQIRIDGAGLLNGGARTADGGSLVEVAAAEPAPLDVWLWIAVVADFAGDSIELYVDGERRASAAPVGFAARSADSVSTRTVIGVDDILTAGAFHGSIDEARLSLQARPADWIDAQYASMTDALIEYGPEESLP
jgi:hypothetical protein